MLTLVCLPHGGGGAHDGELQQPRAQLPLGRHVDDEGEVDQGLLLLLLLLLLSLLLLLLPGTPSSARRTPCTGTASSTQPSPGLTMSEINDDV